MKNRTILRRILLSSALFLTNSAIAQVFFLGTESYTENFNELASTGSSHTYVDNSTIVGVTVNSEEMDSNNDEYFVSTGSSSGGEVYSFGATGSSDRALGYVGSGSNDRFNVYVSLVNSSGSTISSLNVSYDGEYWRSGGTTSDNQNFLNFSFAVDAPTLPTSTSTVNWTEVDALDYSLTPAQQIISTGAKDGNAFATKIEATITSIAWTPDSTLYLRWTGNNGGGTDAGIAIDDLSVAVPEPSTYALIAGILGLTLVILKRGQA